MPHDNRPGTVLMIAATLVFAVQDGISRHLAASYSVPMVVMIRFWFLGIFVLTLQMRRQNGLRGAIFCARPGLQLLRGLLLALEVNIMVASFVLIGLIASNAVFAIYPLIVAALSATFLGERVGWQRWLAIGAGAAGMLIVLRPGTALFSPLALVPLASAILFAIYNLLTRRVAAHDPASTSFFWMGIVGMVVLTPVGLLKWQPLEQADFGWMAALCVTGALGHYLLIKALAVAEAAAIQPFAFGHVVFAGMIGIIIFNEPLHANVALGAAVIFTAGLFALLRERQKV